MAINPEVFIYPADRKFLKKLKAVPGFSTLIKAFKKVWNEQNFKIELLSSKLQVNEKQLPEYYRMLTDICQKLGIDVPELYIESNPYPDSYTIGDKEPMIVLTTGLIEALPTELIPTVLAHECGHIVCGHVLYTTIAYLVIKKGIISSISSLLSTPLEIGFYYWMKASEYSADKAAAVIDGTGDKVADMCIYLAGYSKSFPFKPDRTAFIKQAEDYDEEFSDSKTGKAFEQLNLKRKDHPLCAVRAKLCYETASDESFKWLCRYVEEEAKGITEHDHIPVPCIPEELAERSYDEVVSELKEAGFTNITGRMIIPGDSPEKERRTVAVKIGGCRDYDAGDLFDKKESCVISYLAGVADIGLSEGKDLITVPHGSSYYVGTEPKKAEEELKGLGFENITFKPQKRRKKTQKVEPGTTVSITIGGLDKFRKNTRFEKDADVVIEVVSTEKE